jgi:single-strand DNA-binding protein
MEQLKVTGQVFKVSEKIVKSEKFTFRNLWLTHGDKYPQTIEIQFVNDKCALLDSVTPGDRVTIGINLDGRVWNGQDGQKVFNTIKGWSIEMAGQVKQETSQPYQERMMESTSQKIERLRNLEQLTKEGDDLLPF